jgi:hypothetical protein
MDDDFLAGFLGMVALIVLLVLSVAVVVLQPHSTPGIPVVAYNTARISPGQTLVIKQSKQTWYITYGGGASVKFDCSALCFNDQTAVLCGIGCTVTVPAGLWRKPFTVTQKVRGTVDVVWPDQWSTTMR